MPERRSLQFSRLDDIADEIDRLHRDGYERAGNWSLSQCCDHLSDWMSFPIDGFPKIPFPINLLLGAMRMMSGKAMLRKIIGNQSMRTGQPTIAQTVHADHHHEEASVARLQSALRRLAEHAGPFHPSPLFGTLTREEVIQLQMTHCAHHLSFLIPKKAP